MKDVEGHEWLGIDTADGGRTFTALCSCGWRSRPYSRPGLAGAASDKHRAEAADQQQHGGD